MVQREYRPTVAQLRTFVTIAEHGHFGTAAAHLGISQPSLSQALAALEAGLGVQLIERSTRKVIVTPVGRGLLPFAQATLESLETFVTHARGAHGGLVGSLAIGMIPTVAPYILPDVLHTVNDVAPKLEPRIVEEKSPLLVDALRQGKIDVAVLGMPGEGGGLNTVDLYTEEFVLVLPEGHSLAGRKDLTVDELKNIELLLLDDGHCLRDQILELCRTVDMANDPRHSVTRAASLSTVIQLVAAGLGATLVPLSAVAVECQRPGIALATFAGGAVRAGRTIGMAYRSSSTRIDDYAALGEIVAQSFNHVAKESRRVLETFL
ncbi:hydrogen peroxide-inducible genes activator [Corynebacterium jeikeium]|uniref:Probable hydrogen peroxide-inducible genes activator n=1 Tax=Corynebacterium jeikeium (strain K411) TaxID=306537 RepID=Q4JV91_CORJK|nr:hydrogen peroxide-inducible genes activator [Corynebacterium jeikeium]OOD29378.1 LysR family transcriptional regulator [Corynebacterium jeikeium]WCZ53654.1 putative hydrogen peroxide-inducible genes activator [Corynebacterium jeikeium]CAI37266.1 putative transcriptional regulator (LysR family) [Corynebacterium jeikeium K411]SCX16226.1 putative hydrogen peroxide-inducible genes activator [Corynebacterium jeikeium]SQI20776.1 LysR family transcriptional regulator [Corynebacterium jeikeium]